MEYVMLVAAMVVGYFVRVGVEKFGAKVETEVKALEADAAKKL